MSPSQMARVLIILLLIGLVWLVLRRLSGLARKRTEHPAPPQFEKTVRCARCGVHLPVSLASEEKGHYVCSGDCAADRR